MLNFNYTIKDPVGIHARPAGKFVKFASSVQSTITIEKDGKKADAKKLFQLITLGVKQGHEVIVTVDGDDEKETLDAVKAFFNENL